MPGDVMPQPPHVGLNRFTLTSSPQILIDRLTGLTQGVKVMWPLSPERRRGTMVRWSMSRERKRVRYKDRKQRERGSV